MGRYRDEAPVGNTCPLIDQVIFLINDLSNYDTSVDDDKIDMQYDIKDANNLLEKIRSANSSLRDWGNELYSEKEDLEKQVSDLTDEVTNLKDELKKLESQITELENNT
jgi:predicted  nucleic acid-binding Zn-ribbon protein